MEMGFLLVLALLSCTASFVHLASNKTSQGACSPQPCSTICGATTPYDECTQYCTAGGCDTLVCTSSIVNCTQFCTGGGCKLLECNSKRCEQICTGGECNMTCLSNTDECNQHCTAGGCTFRCEADKCFQFCTGGGCTVIKATTSPASTGADSKASVVSGLMLAIIAFVNNNQYD